MIYVFDLDGTLCVTPHDGQRWQYEDARPIPERIAAVNALHAAGHTVQIDTARGCSSGKDWSYLTAQQLMGWGVKYDVARCGVKFSGDLFVDDRAVGADAFFAGVGS